jgi:type I restriction-modification system DNA methylase subunit
MDKALETVRQLVKDFRGNEAYYLSPKYAESETRQDFIDKFFTALGWDVAHNVQKDPYAQEVKIENRVETGGSQRKADYAFHIAPHFHDVKFFVEAKKPSRDLLNADYYHQTIRYGWNAGTPIAVLTDFAELHIIDCRYKPDIATALDKRLKIFRYEDYTDAEKFAEIFYLIGRDAVANGSLEKYAAELPKPRGKAKQRGLFKSGYQPVDEAFLEELDGFRETLAKAFKKANQDLEGEELTEAVQRTIDRLVFIRFLEDKGIEEPEIINFGSQTTPFPVNRDHPSSERMGRNIVSEPIQEWGRDVSPLPSVKASMQKSAWSGFLALCKRLEPKYNGLVFKPHQVLEGEDFHPPDDDQFADICRKLADPSSPYDFNQIPISILGSIYERFLGKVVHATAKRVSIEEKPEVRKAGGVYYTPQYIVRYIVNETVGKLIQDKTPKEISTMAFADIACGSGSFLIEVYSRLLLYHVQWYAAHPDQIKDGDTYEQDGKLYLTLKKKKDILLNNVYGVDIDSQATEVTQLSLYLKILEDVSLRDAHQYGMFKETILPDLRQNIISGNSLIGRDILDGNLFDEDAEHTLKPMDFRDAFREIMERGGFDAVVGNPPYGGLLTDEQTDYLVQHYRMINKFPDTYCAFVVRACTLAKREAGISFIVPNTFCDLESCDEFRSWLLREVTLQEIWQTGWVFKEAVVDTIVFRIINAPAPADAEIEIILDLSKYIRTASSFLNNLLCKIDYRNSEEGMALVKKITARALPLGTFCTVKAGVKMYEKGKGSPPQSAKLIESRPFSSVGQCPPGWRLLLRGENIVRYDIHPSGEYVNYGVWLAAPRSPELFVGPKVLMRRTDDKLRACIDIAEAVCVNSCHVIKLNEPSSISSYQFLLGLINSRLLQYIFELQNPQMIGKVFAEIKVIYVERLPIRPINFNDTADKARHDAIVKLVETMLATKERLAAVRTDAEATRLESLCDALDRQIDQAVYELYGLTEEDIEIVEGN